MYEIPCCEAGAFKKIRQVEVIRVTGGIVMLDQILSEGKAMDLQGRKEIGDELLKQVKIFNYVPKPAEEQYRVALIEEFGKYRKSRERGV